MTKTIIIKKINDIRAKVNKYKAKGQMVGFVPTMGALHIGHESLIERARKECDIVIVSIFVNPTQFGPNEDFNKYPRQLEADSELCSKHSVDVVFAPDSKDIYPEGDATVVVSPGQYQDRLCEKSRPGHFNGVTTVVAKLFNIITPDKAYLGQKDAQQLAIIKKMVRDLNFSVEIVPCPTVRDVDGLAFSSRNKYLALEAREKALSLYRCLKKAVEDGDLEQAKSELHAEVELEYLEKVSLGEDDFIAIAAKVDGVRLIDNISMPL